MRPAVCVLRPVLQPAANSCVRTRNRVHVDTSTLVASKIAGSSIAPLVEMQRKLKYSMFNSVPEACGKV